MTNQSSSELVGIVLQLLTEQGYEGLGESIRLLVNEAMQLQLEKATL